MDEASEGGERVDTDDVKVFRQRKNKNKDRERNRDRDVL